ncbi:MAG: sulfotransferase family 2 domain-containing protein [Balneolaceae bacterium]
MKQAIDRAYKELKLRYRFACRQLGIERYQVHQICLPDYKLLYIPVPKNACTSIKQALHYIEFGRLFDTSRDVHAAYTDIHDYYKKQPEAFTSINDLKEVKNLVRFAVVRDPLERLISCYRNRVVQLGDLHADAGTLEKINLPAEPDLNTFILNLRKYRKASKSIEHHSRPQSSFFGGTLAYLDHVFPIEKSDDLHEMLQEYSQGLKLLKRKSGGPKADFSDLSKKAQEHAIRFYQKDYKLLSNFYLPPL